MSAEDTIDNNYIVKGCSAKMLYCEPKSEYPNPLVGGSLPEAVDSIMQITRTRTSNSSDHREGCTEMEVGSHDLKRVYRVPWKHRVLKHLWF